MPEREKPERDPLDELKAAWSALESPDPTRETNDERTEVALTWMRAAWAELESPRVEVPPRLRRRGSMRRVRTWAPLVAAAAVVLLAAGWWWSASRSSQPEVAPLEVAEVGPETEVGTADPLVPESNSHAAEVGALESPEVHVENDGETLVMEHGSVRLLFLTPIDEPVPGLDNTTEN